MQTSLVHFGFYSIGVDRLSYLICKTLVLSGFKVSIKSELNLNGLLTQPESPGVAEIKYYSWLFSDLDIEVVGDRHSFPVVDILFYDIRHTPPQCPDHLRQWINHSKQIAAWSTCLQEYGWFRNLHSDIAGIAKYKLLLTYPSRIIVRGGSTRSRPMLGLAKASKIGYFVNPYFLKDVDLRYKMFTQNWRPEFSRFLRLLFAGNLMPLQRKRIIETVGQYLRQASQVQVLTNLQDFLKRQNTQNSNQASILWMERSGDVDLSGQINTDTIPPSQWADILSQADFSFCPPGYERKTHRVIESLLQGAIPILDCPEEYDIELQDGVNCLVVRHNDWIGAVQRALAMSIEDVTSLRFGVEACRNRYLTLESAGRHLAEKLGWKD